MAGSPQFKVYGPANQYEAAVKHAEVAAMLVATLGDGWTVRNGHAKRDIVWTEGAEQFSAAESYDGAAEVMHIRMRNGSDGQRLAALYAERFVTAR